MPEQESGVMPGNMPEQESVASYARYRPEASYIYYAKTEVYIGIQNMETCSVIVTHIH